ncbi:MAG TPA: inositol monophosphatase family protein [Streptosporangiaceae bacterium]|jgi:myo-inositol-1(or 4)-monophosphatase|nr:inositol monophosphatase family protein [Streptosporangiaceae bacterium]
MTGPEPEELLALAAETAAAAATLLAEEGAQQRPDVVQTKSSLTDVVTEMDRRAEALITERIRAARPDDAILGEEGGETQGAAGAPASAGGPAVRWIVDPLDGTVNYLYGLADWSVSIAAEVAGAIVAGVVAIPLRGETYLAARGHGATVRTAAGQTAAAGRAPVLRCNRDVPLAQALVGTGFGYLPGRRRIQGEVVSALLPRIRDIRRGGSASVDLCSVAAGRLDAFYERGLNYWDYAAGGLIAEEAGARLTGLDGRPAGPSFTVAAGPGLYEELAGALTALTPERDD